MKFLVLWLISFSLQLHRTEAVSNALHDDWKLINENRSIVLNDISLPSGVYSELENAQLTESVLFSYNDVELRWIGLENWTYILEFNQTVDDLKHEFVILTCKGLDTLSEIFLNGESIGTTNNMFVRYRFNVKDSLVEGANELLIKFTSPVEGARNLNSQRDIEIPPACPPQKYNGECHMNLLRKMQASFAWDWGLAAPSMGIWKPVLLEVYDSVNIRDITYQLIDGAEGSESSGEITEDIWKLKVFVHMETGLKSVELNGIIQVELIDLQGCSSYMPLQVKSDANGEYTSELQLALNKSLVREWWPNGYGSQSLYGLRVKWEDTRMNDVMYKDRVYLSSTKTINIGFRTIELVQEQLSNGLSFYFKVNGHPIFMKGSNWIPSHVLPEKSYDTERVKELLLAARDANMNMMRVWGGGVYESNYFYSLADEYGILIWQDLMFACAMYPSDDDFLDSVRTEVKMQVRRIQHHPSIALFATNNENEVALRQDWYGTNSRFQDFAEEYRKLYVETITDEIKKHDPTREVLTSSPSNGNYDGDREFGIGMDPQNSHYGDIHFYVVDHNAWKPTIFPLPRFVSEYGFQSFPTGWSSVMRKDDNLTDLITHRQHHPLGSGPIKFLIEENLKVEFDSLSWDNKIYLSQLSQAMAIKTETEFYRSGRASFMNTMGALYWQLNDVWVAPSWSSIEYNGNFKILHHWIQQIFAPLTIIPQMTLLNKLQIYVLSDEINVEIKPITIRLNVYKWDNFLVVKSREWNCNITANTASLIEEFDLNKYMTDNRYDVDEYVGEFLLINDADGEVISKNHVFPGNYKHLKSVVEPKPQLKLTINKCDKGTHKISLEVKVDAPAIFMAIALVHDDIKKYRLSKNGYMQLEPIQVVEVTFANTGCQSVITAEHFVFKTLNKFLM